MGFPYEPASWDGVSGAIFMGFGGGAPGFYSLIAIALSKAQRPNNRSALDLG